MRTTPLLCLAVLLFLVPFTGRAQSSNEGPASAPPVVRAPDETQPGHGARLVPEANPSYARPLRIAAGTLVGTLSAGVGGLATMLGGVGLAGPSRCALFESCSLKSAPEPYVGLLVGSALAGSAAYYGIGSLIYGRGSFLYTLLGATASMALLGVPVFARQIDSNYLFLSPLLATVGAAVGYELSHHPIVRRDDTAGARVVPVLGATPGGGLLGLAGTF